MMYHRLTNNSYEMYPEERAAMKLAEAQHAPGVTCRMNSNFRVEYVNPDGTIVPGYEYFLRKEKEAAR